MRPRSTPPAAIDTPSLRSRLLRHVLAPLALTWLVGTVISVKVATESTQRAFDRSILDDAYAVAANVRPTAQGLMLMLSPREMKTVLFDQVEVIQYAVLHVDGRPIAGDTLPVAVPAPGEDDIYRFSDLEVHGKMLRGVRLHVDGEEPFEVVILATIHGRQKLLRNIVLYGGGSQLLLLLVLAAWLRRSISRDLQPLTTFQDALDERHARDLAPLHLPRAHREIEHIGRAVNALLERVARGVSAQREFAGNIAHELRTPLAGIRAQASYGLAQKDAALWRDALVGIVRSEARASHLVDQLLALALADESQPHQWVQLDELVHEAVLRFLPRADAEGVDLGARGLEVPLAVRSNPVLLEGVLNNLIDNALRYGRAPTDPQVTIELRPEGDRVVLAVIDNGPGIAAPEQARLMGRGVQGIDGVRLGEGAGLGLSIVARYAQLLDAPLDMHSSERGQGLEVRLLLPGPVRAHAVAPATARAAGDHSSRADLAVSGKSLNTPSTPSR